MSAQPSVEQLLSTIYHALRTERRRQVIRTLRETDARVLTTRELAREIASIERDVALKRATGEPYRNAYNALSQTHLPTLSDADIIIYDPNRQTVRRGEYFQLTSLLLDSNLSMTRTISSLFETNSTEFEEEPQ